MRLVLFFQYPFTNHIGLLLDSPGIRLASLVLVVSGVALTAFRPVNYKVLGVCVVLTGVLVALYLANKLTWLYIGLPLLVPVVLLTVFGQTLLPGREALVTGIGERARGPLTAQMRNYTRNITWLWVVVFLLLIVSALLSLMLPFVDGVKGSSWVLNIFAPLLVGVVFLGEFMLRKRLFPDHDHPSLVEYIAIVRQGR